MNFEGIVSSLLLGKGSGLVVGVAKWRIIRTIKGSSTRQKLQNSKGYAESPEFLPALGLIIFMKKSVATKLR